MNVNYRYVADELRYLFADADLKLLVADPELAPSVDAVRADLPLLEHIVYAGDDVTRRCVAAALARAARRVGAARATTSTSSTPAAPRACPRA